MNRKSFDFDLVSVTLYLVLVGLGWLTIYAVSSTGTGTGIFAPGTFHTKQLIWIGISLVAAWLVLLLDSRFIEAVSVLAYIVSIGLLILVLIVGKEVNGAKSWILIAGQQFQPSEFAKLATAMALAKYMSALNFSLKNPRQLAGALGIVLVPAIIVILQNDTGSALVFGSFLLVFYREGLHPLVPLFLFFLALVGILVLWSEAPGMVSLGIGVLAVAAFVFGFSRRFWGKWLSVVTLSAIFFVGFAYSVDYLVNQLAPHQQIRLKVWFNPNLDPQGAGYNVIHSKIAIGSGGVYGKGFLNGNYTKYRFVPKQETDFIFCTIGEELGWIGTTGVMVVFFLLLLRIRFLAENAKTRYARIYGYSIMLILFFHVVVNLGMTIGLIPVIGIPLPFFSYGGSSLLVFTIMLFLLINLFSYRVSVLGSKI
ncbi:MAG: rod shape-determining protein RodA [Bacteroidota bacterium]